MWLRCMNEAEVSVTCLESHVACSMLVAETEFVVVDVQPTFLMMGAEHIEHMSEEDEARPAQAEDTVVPLPAPAPASSAAVEEEVANP